MADEVQGAAPAPKKKLNAKMMIIIGGSVLVFAIGGFSGYKIWSGKKAANVEGEKTAVEETKSEGGEKGGKSQSIIPLEPFVVNLSAPGRYLKATMHLELKNPAEQEAVNQHMAMVRDVIITVLSSKSADAVSGPEGKFALKDELLFRVNQALGKEAVKNIYFTEFVMQ